jgi:ribosomal protein S18 acetylase RimI-like enzyme
MMNIRRTKSNDIASLMLVLDQTELFPSEMLPDMIGSSLDSQSDTDIWLTCDENGTAVGFCYAIPEKLTEGTWNVLALAVLPSLQGQGIGRAIVQELEAILQKAGHRVLIADTSSDSAFDGTRAFYRKIGYTEEARIRDFWASGNDKIVFWKAL